VSIEGEEDRRTPPSFEELMDDRPSRHKEAGALLAEKRAYEKARGSERARVLLAALVRCGPFRPLPHWLFTAQCEMLSAMLEPEPPKKWRLWYLFRAHLDAKDGEDRPRYGWDEALRLAAEEAAARGIRNASETTVRKAFAEKEKELPPEARRPLTHSRRRLRQK
jgi:hypothetical protein